MEPLTLFLPADPAELSRLRRTLRSWLEGLEVVEADVAGMVAACSEVAADAVEDTPSHAADAIEITAAMTGGDVVVRCAVAGDWGIAQHPSRYVAALLVDDLSIEQRDGRTAVVLRKAFDRGLRNLQSL